MAEEYGLDRVLWAGAAQVPLRVREGERGWDELATELADLAADRCVVLTDGVPPEGLTARLPLGQRLRVPGAATLQTVERLADRIAAEGLTRRTVLLAVGGEGLAGTAGVLAGLLLGGLRLVRVPTTLAALCGPALSPVQHLPGGGLGLHHAPTLVRGQLDLLAAEPVAQLRAGLVTVVRHVLAVCPARLSGVSAVLRPEAGYRPAELGAFVALCADARAAVAGYDPLELGPARALAYGQVLGQGIREVTGLPSGEAEGLGLLAAARISAHLGLLTAEDEHAHRDLLRRVGLPLGLPPGTDPAAVATAVRRAAAARGDDGLLLLAGLGRPHTADGSLLTRIGPDTLRVGLAALIPTAVPASRTATALTPAER
ncbi:hypothetical protein ABT095_07360 [Kitasatospora sp. NPDC002227]|uniref:3-dehydroquinate synthase family protein n=1 Tax=Kitasatospora sp. NPDC002227 TaxID=3154773 RepID=UPI00333206CA